MGKERNYIIEIEVLKTGLKMAELQDAISAAAAAVGTLSDGIACFDEENDVVRCCL